VETSQQENPMFGRRSFRRRFLLIPALLIGGAALVGWGFGGHGHCGGKNPERMERHMKAFLEDRLEDLDATDAQQKQIQAIAAGLFGEAKAMHAEREDMREQFLSFWDAESPDPKAVHAAVDARIEKLRAIAHKAADAGLQVHGVLKPEQRGQVSEAIRERTCGK
jgi:protein CpxP